MTFADAVLALIPYNFSPLIVIAFALVLGFYLMGVKRLTSHDRPGIGRVITFLLGLGLCYGVLQTRFDFYAQHLFFAHRAQHLIIHHVGPILIALSNPLPVAHYWYRQLSAPLQAGLARLGWLYRFLQHPVIAALLFVGLVYLWLWPDIHFSAMRNRALYELMNLSLLLEGLLFWWLMLDPRRPQSSVALGYGKRILVLIAVMIPQIAIGAWITFQTEPLYDVYRLMEQPLNLEPIGDQLLGGILTWIPPALMSVLGSLILLSFIARDDRLDDLHRRERDNDAGANTAPVA